MVYFRKGRFGKKKKSFKKKFLRPVRSLRSSSLKISRKRPHFFKQIVDKPGIIQSASADVIGQLTFSLNDVDQKATFAALFDIYKLCFVKVEFMPRQNAFPAQVPGNINLGRLYTVIDYDGQVPTPGSVVAFRQYETCREVESFKRIKLVLKPRFSNITNSFSVSTPYHYSSNRGWVDTIESDGTPDSTVWYGVFYLLAQGVAAQTILSVYDIKCTYYLAFKNVK